MMNCVNFGVVFVLQLEVILYVNDFMNWLHLIVKNWTVLGF